MSTTTAKRSPRGRRHAFLADVYQLIEEKHPDLTADEVALAFAGEAARILQRLQYERLKTRSEDLT